MASSILLPASIDVSKISYGTPRNLDTAGKARIVPMNFNGGPLIMQTPTCRAPFGARAYEEGGSKLNMELAITDAAFAAKLHELDAKVMSDMLVNSSAWLKKKHESLDVIQALYTPMVKLAKDRETGEVTDKYPPTFKTVIPLKDGHYNCEFYNAEKQKIDPADFNVDSIKGSMVTAIVQCTGLWVAGGKFGCNWRVVQMKINPRNNQISGYAFVEGDGEEEVEMLDE